MTSISRTLRILASAMLLVTYCSPAYAEPAGESPDKVVNSVGMTLKRIPAGEFTMGSPESEEGRHEDEGPARLVRISRPFYMATCEVTQSQWEKVTGTTLADISREDSEFYGRGPSHPIYRVTWFDTVDFCNRLSKREGKSPYYRLTDIERDYYGSKPGIKSAEVKVLGGNGYHLPTEAQWEYACRAGTATPFSFAVPTGAKPRLLVRIVPMLLAFTICTAIYGNGAATGTAAFIIKTHRRLIRQVHPVACIAYYVEAVSKTSRVSAAPPIGWRWHPTAEAPWLDSGLLSTRNSGLIYYCTIGRPSAASISFHSSS